MVGDAIPFDGACELCLSESATKFDAGRGKHRDLGGPLGVTKKISTAAVHSWTSQRGDRAHRHPSKSEDLRVRGERGTGVGNSAQGMGIDLPDRSSEVDEIP